MAQFRFRLATLQRLREIRRDELQAKLAEAYQARQILEQQLDELKTDLGRLQVERRTAASNPQPSMNVLVSAQRYQSVLIAQQNTMSQQAAILEAETERRRLAVVEADREVRVLEKLSERQLAQHRIAIQHAEAKEFDEIASRHHQEKNPWAL